jgi:hypothetical protein
MKRTLLIALTAFAVIGVTSAQVRAASDCPPGQHLASTAGKFGRNCYPNSAAPAAAAATCVRQRVCQDGHCTTVCR